MHVHAAVQARDGIGLRSYVESGRRGIPRSWLGQSLFKCCSRSAQFMLSCSSAHYHVNTTHRAVVSRQTRTRCLIAMIFSTWMSTNGSCVQQRGPRIAKRCMQPDGDALVLVVARLLLLMRVLIVEYMNLIYRNRWPIQWGMKECFLAIRDLQLKTWKDEGDEEVRGREASSIPLYACSSRRRALTFVCHRGHIHCRNTTMLSTSQRTLFSPSVPTVPPRFEVDSVSVRRKPLSVTAMKETNFVLTLCLQTDEKDVPWLYAYIRGAFKFWRKFMKFTLPGTKRHDPEHYIDIDAIGEILDNLRGVSTHCVDGLPRMLVP